MNSKEWLQLLQFITGIVQFFASRGDNDTANNVKPNQLSGGDTDTQK